MKSTLEKIVVMVAFDQGKNIEITRLFDGARFGGITAEPTWNWIDFDYDVMVEPVECWVWIYADGSVDDNNYSSEIELLTYRHGLKGRPVHMREVIK